MPKTHSDRMRHFHPLFGESSPNHSFCTSFSKSGGRNCLKNCFLNSFQVLACFFSKIFVSHQSQAIFLRYMPTCLNLDFSVKSSSAKATSNCRMKERALLTSLFPLSVSNLMSLSPAFASWRISPLMKKRKRKENDVSYGHVFLNDGV